MSRAQRERADVEPNESLAADCLASSAVTTLLFFVIGVVPDHGWFVWLMMIIPVDCLKLDSRHAGLSVTLSQAQLILRPSLRASTVVLWQPVSCSRDSILYHYGPVVWGSCIPWSHDSLSSSSSKEVTAYEQSMSDMAWPGLAPKSLVNVHRLRLLSCCGHEPECTSSGSPNAIMP